MAQQLSGAWRFPARVYSSRCRFAILMLAAACYAYRPTSTSPAPGATVRIILTTATTVVVVAPAEPSDRREIEGVLEASGTIVATAADTISVRMGELRTINGTVPDVAGRIALVPTHGVAKVTEKRLDAGRSLLAGGGVLLVATTVLILLLVVTVTKAAGG